MDFFTLSVPPCFVSLSPEPPQPLSTQALAEGSPENQKNNARDLPSPKKSKKSPREPKNHARDLPRPPKSKKSAQPRPENQNARSETLRGPKPEKIIIELIIELLSQNNH